MKLNNESGIKKKLKKNFFFSPSMIYIYNANTNAEKKEDIDACKRFQ